MSTDQRIGLGAGNGPTKLEIQYAALKQRQAVKAQRVLIRKTPSSVKLTLTTKDGRQLLRSMTREFGEPRGMESYASPLGEIEIICSTNEREEAEEITLDSDVPNAGDFTTLTLYLLINARLQVQNADIKPIETPNLTLLKRAEEYVARFAELNGEPAGGDCRELLSAIKAAQTQGL